jgi:hypothetical protein
VGLLNTYNSISMIPQLASLAYNDGFEMPGDGGGAPDYSSAMGNVRFQAIPVNQGMMALMAAANNANAEVEPVMPPSSNPINIGPLAQNPLVSMAVNSILQSFFQSSGFNIGQFLPQYSYSRQVKSFALSRRIAATAAAVSPLDKTSIAASLSKPFRAIAPGMSQDTIDNIAGYLASPTGMMVAKTGAYEAGLSALWLVPRSRTRRCVLAPMLRQQTALVSRRRRCPRWSTWQRTLNSWRAQCARRGLNNYEFRNRSSRW